MTPEITLDSLIEEYKKIEWPLHPDYQDYLESLFIDGELYEIDSFNENYNFNQCYIEWFEKTKRFLNSQFSNDIHIDEFETIGKSQLCRNQQQQLLAILEAFRAIPEVIKNKQQKADGSNNVFNNYNYNSNSQSQYQSQSVQIFFEAIKDELTGEQQKELKSIVDEDLEPEAMRTKIFDKIKNFGIDTLSNIVANIATNPAVWG